MVENPFLTYFEGHSLILKMTEAEENSIVSLKQYDEWPSQTHNFIQCKI